MTPDEIASRWKQLPSVRSLLDHPALQSVQQRVGASRLRQYVRGAIESLRRDLAGGGSHFDRDSLTRQAIDLVNERADLAECNAVRRVINATGVILHTGLGRAPLSDAAVSAIAETATGCNLEVDLDEGDRKHRGYQVQSALRDLTGAEAALVVNNNAAATVLALAALCRGREVLISRGQLIEIGGSFRLPEVFAESGAVLREVGTTNRTHLGDYASAIGPNTAAILRVHTSNYRIVGFAAEPGSRELASVARANNLLFLDDIGSGCLIGLESVGLPAEPTFPASLTAGADLVLGSGDKLLGGPQCGLLLGRHEVVDRVRSHPLARAVRIDKLTLAALDATLQAYLRGTHLREIPTLRMLTVDVASLKQRAESWASRLKSANDLDVAAINDQSTVGGGALPTVLLPTFVLRLTSKTRSADSIARRLRTGVPGVFPRVQDDAVLLDPRTVRPEDDEELCRAVVAAATAEWLR
jgi:L-seryl-tRNA(Ser) seleniumtransferase